MAGSINELIEYVSLYRTVWIGGRLRIGKTAMATIIAKRLLEQGLADGVVSNYPTIFPAHYKEDDGTLYNRVILYDEAWQEHDSRTAMSNDRVLGAWMGKFGAYLICPSVHPIDRRLRAVEVKAVGRNVFTGMTIWRYKVAAEGEEIGGEISIDIKEAWGLYSTAFIPNGNYGIIDRFLITHYLHTGERYNVRENRDRQIMEAAAGIAASN